MSPKRYKRQIQHHKKRVKKRAARGLKSAKLSRERHAHVRRALDYIQSADLVHS